jgi:uncharacterized small protein (DUF1192 family)
MSLLTLKPPTDLYSVYSAARDEIINTENRARSTVFERARKAATLERMDTKPQTMDVRLLKFDINKNVSELDAEISTLLQVVMTATERNKANASKLINTYNRLSNYLNLKQFRQLPIRDMEDIKTTIDTLIEPLNALILTTLENNNRVRKESAKQNIEPRMWMPLFEEVKSVYNQILYKTYLPVRSNELAVELVKKTEARIPELEAEIARLDGQIQAGLFPVGGPQLADIQAQRDNAQQLLDDLRRTGPSTAVPAVLEAQPSSEAQIEGSRILGEATRLQQRQERIETQLRDVSRNVQQVYGNLINQRAQRGQQITPQEQAQLDQDIANADPNGAPDLYEMYVWREQGPGAEQNRGSRVYFTSRIDAIDAEITRMKARLDALGVNYRSLEIGRGRTTQMPKVPSVKLAVMPPITEDADEGIEEGLMPNRPIMISKDNEKNETDVPYMGYGNNERNRLQSQPELDKLIKLIDEAGGGAGINIGDDSFYQGNGTIITKDRLERKATIKELEFILKGANEQNTGENATIDQNDPSSSINAINEIKLQNVPLSREQRMSLMGRGVVRSGAWLDQLYDTF